MHKPNLGCYRHVILVINNEKIFFLIMFLMITVVANAFDIIVKKDGSTIQAKVEKVTTTEVEYKKASNPDGPTYTVSISDLISINYQNGSKDVFTSTNDSSNTHSTTHTGFVTDETASRYSQDEQILRQYNAEMYSTYKKKAKTWKVAGLIGGSAVVVAGGVLYYLYYFNESNVPNIGLGLAGLGVAGGITCYLIGNSYSKKAVSSNPLISFDCNFDNSSRLCFSVDAVGSYNNPGIGLGVRYSF